MYLCLQRSLQVQGNLALPSTSFPLSSTRKHKSETFQSSHLWLYIKLSSELRDAPQPLRSYCIGLGQSGSTRVKVKQEHS